MNSIFEITVVYINGRPSRDYHYTVSEGMRAFFESYEAADEYIHTHINELQEECNIYCIYLREKPLNRAVYAWKYLSIWLYDENGVLIDKRLADNIDDNILLPWRKYNEFRFHGGDLVEWLNGNEVSLVHIAGRPLTEEEIIHCDEHASHLTMTADEDQVTIIEDDSFDSHWHVDALNLFKPHFKIHQSTLAMYNRMYKRYLQEIEEYNKENHCNSTV